MLVMHAFLPILVMGATPQDQQIRKVAMLSACAVRRRCRGDACGAYGRQPGLAAAGYAGGCRG